MMIMQTVGKISMAVTLVVLLGLLPAASLALSEEESPEAAASCTGTGTTTITGHVTTASGQGISGVTIKLTGPSSCTNTTTTNSSGAYSFRNLGQGTYTVSASKTGCTFSKAPSKKVGSILIIINFTGTCQ
jgi:hypothetical protein